MVDTLFIACEEYILGLWEPGGDALFLTVTLVQICAESSFSVSVIAHWIPKVKRERTYIVTPYVPLGKKGGLEEDEGRMKGKGSGKWGSNSETGIAVAAGQCCHSNQTSNQVWPGGLLVTKIIQRHARIPPPHKNIVIRKLLLKYYVATHHTLVHTKMVFRLFTILK